MNSPRKKTVSTALAGAALAVALAGVPAFHGLSCSRAADTTRETNARRAPDVPYEPSPPEVVTEMLRLAGVGAGDLVYDLGCGDGRIVIAAVKEHGARGVCVDIDPQRIRESEQNAQQAGVADRITFLNEDLFDSNLQPATVVTLFLWPKINLRLKPKLLRELRPGARIVSYMHDMADWQPDETRSVRMNGRSHDIYLWTVPLRASE